MGRKYIIGSISSGTLRAEDLIPSFVDCLDELVEDLSLSLPPEASAEQQQAMVREVARITDLLAAIEARQAKDGYFDSEECLYDIESLEDELGNHAPPYFHFGAHPGDGADFGFWLSDDSLTDFDGARVSDLSEVPDDYCGDVLLVNDHGNTSLYFADNGKLTEIWAIV
jgi:hypothetical protein